jgi:iron complex transport system permease protein
MTRWLPLLILALVASFALSLLAGKVWVPLDLWGGDDPRAWIIAELRLPRALLAALIGGSLGLCGAVLQGYLRNPLADPGVLGISASASLGAVLSLFFGLSSWALPGFAMLGAGLAMALLVLLAGRSGSMISFVLAGVIVSAIAGALTGLIISLAPNPFATSEIVTWLMGALTDRSWPELGFAAPFIVLGSLLLLLSGSALDALSLGDAAARSLGISLPRLQALILLGTALSVGAGVAVTGVIGFVGLIVPHLLRPLVGAQPSALLLPSALAGASLLLVADALVRLIPGPGELKLGIAMALIGGPFFLALLWRLKAVRP